MVESSGNIGRKDSLKGKLVEKRTALLMKEYLVESSGTFSRKVSLRGKISRNENSFSKENNTW